MALLTLPNEILEKIVDLLDASSALSLVQVCKRINQTFTNSKRFWLQIANAIGLYVGVDDSVSIIKARFFDWKTGNGYYCDIICFKLTPLFTRHSCYNIMGAFRKIFGSGILFSILF